MIHDADSFLQFLADEKRLSPNTLAAYRNDLRQFEEYLAARQHDPLGTGSTNGNGIVKPADRRSRLARANGGGFFLSLREDKGYSAATIARKMAAVKSLFHYFTPAGDHHHQPDGRPRLAEVKKPLPPISVEDVDRLMRQTDKKATPEGLRDRAMLHLLYAAACASRSWSLDLNDLDFERGAVRCVGRGLRVGTSRPIRSR